MPNSNCLLSPNFLSQHCTVVQPRLYQIAAETQTLHEYKIAFWAFSALFLSMLKCWGRKRARAIWKYRATKNIGTELCKSSDARLREYIFIYHNCSLQSIWYICLKHNRVKMFPRAYLESLHRTAEVLPGHRVPRRVPVAEQAFHIGLQETRRVFISHCILSVYSNSKLRKHAT